MTSITTHASLTLNIEQAENIGRLLQDSREKQQLPIQEVADKLLLSKQQIIGLEAAEIKNFYGVRLYAQAADKYAAYLGLSTVPSELLFEVTQSETLDTINPANLPTLSVNADDRPSAEIAKPKRLLKILFVGLGLLGLIAGIISVLIATRVDTPIKTEPLSPQPRVTAQAAPEPDKTSTPVAPVLEPTTDNDIASGKIRINFSGTSWVQVVDANGTKQEKMYHQNDKLDLEPTKLQALIIGNANAVTLSNNEGEISLKAYVGSGSKVARIIGPEVRKLGQ